MNYRNNAILKAVREAPCMMCGILDGTIVAAHSNQQKDGKGRGIKAHDYRIAALCFKCHFSIDQAHQMSRSERLNAWEEAHRKTIGWLFENNIIVCK